MAKKPTKKSTKKPTKPKKPPIVEFEDTKQDIDAFMGGISVNLKKIVNGVSLKETLECEIGNLLEEEIENQDPYIQQISKWERAFQGIGTGKKAGQSNIHIPFMRWLIETVLVRIFDVIWGQKKLFIVEPTDPAFYEIRDDIEEALEWWQNDICHLKKKMFSPLMQSVKMGTGATYMPYVKKQRSVVVDYDKTKAAHVGLKQYRHGGRILVKPTITTYEGPDVFGLSREDLVSSSDSTDIEDATLSGFRTYIPTSQFKSRVKSKMYDQLSQDDADIIATGDELDEAKEKRIRSQLKNKDVNKKTKVAVWQLYYKYDVDGDGEDDDLVITFHRRTKKIMRCIYNECFYGYRNIQKYIGRPVEYSSDGDGLCKILEHLQAEINTVHNQRRDRMNQINSLMFLRRISAQQGNITPGPWKIINVHDIDKDFKEMRFSDAYPSSMAEESLLNQYGLQAAGVSPHLMGQQTAERPVARDTLALIQEANKLFKFLIDNYRDQLEELGMRAVEQFAQYNSGYEYKVRTLGGNGQPDKWETKNLDLPMSYLRDGIKIRLSASSEVINMEVRREIDMALYQLLRDYFTGLAGMAQALTNPQVPEGVKKLIMGVSAIGAKLMKRIVSDFGHLDSEELVADIADYIDKADMVTMPPQMPPGGPGGAPGAQGPPRPPMPPMGPQGP